GASRVALLGGTLGPGATIVTGAAQSVRLRLSTGGVVTVGEHAQIAFRELHTFPAAGSHRTRLARGYARLHAAGQALVAPLWEGLRAIPGVTVYGPPPGTPRTPTVSFTVAGHSAHDIAVALAARGVFTSHGDFYAATVARRYGTADAGFVRAGCAAYTTRHEVDRLVDGVAALVRA
ncbi:MAG: aminotransferase class V-fold PLP-dependent enzyme, partial [Gemmatirosa sp.]